MRAAPIGAYFHDDPEMTAAQAKASAEVTHMHPDGIAGAIAVAVAAAFVCQWAIDGTLSDNRGSLIASVLPFVPSTTTKKMIEKAADTPTGTSHREAAAELGNGEQIISQDTVPYCLWSVQKELGSFTDALWKTASVFGDIDTNCAIVGSILCLGGPENTVPEEWVLHREPLIG